MSDELTNEALSHAWAWFEYHASQRMTMIRFYLTLAGALGAGVGYLWVQKEFLLSAALSAFGAISSLCFMRLDKRVTDLVKLGEDALSFSQNRLATELAFAKFEICRLADTKKDASGNRLHFYPYTYGENFRLLFSAAAIGFLLMAFVSSFRLFCASQ